MAPLDTITRGTFAPGTAKRNTRNMWDASSATFKALPDGPYEAAEVHDQPTAQDHFNTTAEHVGREIKLPDARRSGYPVPSYIDHYPPKELPSPGETLELKNGQMPFTSRTEYMDEFFRKPRMARPAEPRVYTHKPAPFIVKETTNQHEYKPYELPEGDAAAGQPAASRPATEPPDYPFDCNTTYKSHYVPKDSAGRQPTGVPEPRPPVPWLAGDTTYRDHFVPKELALVPVLPDAAGAPYPFTGTTEYKAEFLPKDAYPVVPPLTGLISKQGLQLPLPRRSLGCEFWHRGKTNQYFMLIPRSADVPSSACQIFTTVNDNQEEACILILYGDDPVASNNMLLGQFDIVNIPPAPKDVPRIEVIFHLDKEMYLTVEARDLDTQRQKKWLQRGEIIVVRK